jgi:hypothetical protein
MGCSASPYVRDRFPRLDLVAVGEPIFDEVLVRLAREGGGSYGVFDLARDSEVWPRAAGVQIRELAVDLDPNRVERYRVFGDDDSNPVAGTGAPGAAWLDAGRVRLVVEVKRSATSSREPLGKLRVEVRESGRAPWKALELAIAPTVHATFDSAPSKLRLAALSGLFAEKLRGTYWVSGLEFPAIERAFARLFLEERRPAELEALAKAVEHGRVLDPEIDTFAVDPRASASVREIPVFAEDEK